MFVLPSTKVEYFESPFYLSHSLALYLFMNLRFYLSVFQSLSNLILEISIQGSGQRLTGVYPFEKPDPDPTKRPESGRFRIRNPVYIIVLCRLVNQYIIICNLLANRLPNIQSQNTFLCSIIIMALILFFGVFCY